ncbi:MAG: hypothetical protein WDO13_08080 [Verrucomicrobiota bacterium]
MGLSPAQRPIRLGRLSLPRPPGPLSRTVGTSGHPPYPTSDDKGGWGGDHGMPSAVAADASGIYFGWVGAEAERQIVKIDYAGNTLWRKSPFVLGGFPTLHALASNGKYLFGVYNGTHPVLEPARSGHGRLRPVQRSGGARFGRVPSVPARTPRSRHPRMDSSRSPQP